MVAAAVLDFQIFKMLTISMVKRVNVCHCAKFCGDRSNRCSDMVIFLFFMMAAAAILDFLNFEILSVSRVKRLNTHHQANFCPPFWICYTCVWTIHEEYLVVFIAVQNLVGIGFVVLKMSFNIVQEWLENAYSCPF